MVGAARNGPAAAIDYLRGCVTPATINFLAADPDQNGRFHYNAELTGFNFTRRSAPFPQFLDALTQSLGDAHAPTFAAQGIVAETFAPRFARDNPLPLYPGEGEARLWLGNRTRVAAHSDAADNIAYCAIGRRRFTLFAPEQVTNLYLGPLEPTPAGTPIAMTDPDEPDYVRYPRFKQAMAAALVAELEPGDAIYIPYGWYHHVAALDPINLLVNFWWREPEPGGSPRDAMMMGMMALRQLPPKARRHWRALFDAYVFETGGPAGGHLPPYARGILDARSPRDLEAMRRELLHMLSQPR